MPSGEIVLKKLITNLSLCFLVLMIAFVFYSEGLTLRSSDGSLDSIQTTDQAGLESAVNCRKKSTREFLTLNCGGYELPLLDPATDTFLLSEQLLDQAGVTVKIKCELLLCRTGSELTLAAFDKTSYRLYTIKLTTLPLLMIETSGQTVAKPLEGEYSEANFTVFDSEQATVERFVSKVKTRGGSSSAYPKKSINLKLVNKNSGSETPDCILGFSKNAEFVLNSLYEDDSKIRDFVSLELWKKIAQSNGGEPIGSIDMRYCEVFVNQSYWGLYGFQENIGVASFYPDSRTIGSIFEVKNYTVPNIDTLNPGAASWGGVELDYSTLSHPWTGFSSWIECAFSQSDEAFCEGVSGYLDKSNCVDYYLWANVLFASDNFWKNVVFIERFDAGRRLFFLTPWDADLTLGALWNPDAERRVELRADLCDKTQLLEGPFFLGKMWELDVGDFRKTVAARWFELRKSAFSDQSLNALIDGTFDELTRSGARARDAARWPDSATCEDNSFIETFVSRRLAYLDAFYAGILAGTGD